MGEEEELTKSEDVPEGVVAGVGVKVGVPLGEAPVEGVCDVVLEYDTVVLGEALLVPLLVGVQEGVPEGDAV